MVPVGCVDARRRVEDEGLGEAFGPAVVDIERDGIGKVLLEELDGLGGSRGATKIGSFGGGAISMIVRRS